LRAFIIGNGPTQANVDLSMLTGETTIAMNDITHRLDEFTPTYWMFFDNSFYRPHMNTISKMQDKGVKLVTISKDISGAERVVVFGNVSYLAQGKIEFYGRSPKFSLTRLYSVGSIGYSALQYAWQKGYRELYVMGFDSRNPRPKEHYCKNYTIGNKPGDSLPKDIWGKAYDYANKWIWEHGGEIWDVSHSKSGSFKYKDLKDIL